MLNFVIDTTKLMKRGDLITINVLWKYTYGIINKLKSSDLYMLRDSLKHIYMSTITTIKYRSPRHRHYTILGIIRYLIFKCSLYTTSWTVYFLMPMHHWWSLCKHLNIFLLVSIHLWLITARHLQKAYYSFLVHKFAIK